MERTLVVLKPDAVSRGIVGEIIARFEKTGLKIAAMKMVVPDEDLINKHYPTDRREFIEGMGKKTLSNYEEQGIDPITDFGHGDAYKYGLEIKKWLLDYWTSGPAIVCVLEGPHAIELTRKITGHTLPLKAQPGTIRGDFSFDSSALANKSRRPIRNLLHASGDKAEAEHEIALWFKPEELYDYNTIHQHHMMSQVVTPGNTRLPFAA